MPTRDLNSMRQPWDGQLCAYTSVGSYPLLYLDSRDNVLCVKCACELDMDPDTELRDLPAVCGINYEDAFLFCDCGERIESAYAEDCHAGTCDGATCALAADHGCAERGGE